MSKPWDSEPTPVMDISKKGMDMACKAITGRARNLERRLRHAERLLAGLLAGCEDCDNDSVAAAAAYLEAARQEDEA